MGKKLQRQKTWVSVHFLLEQKMTPFLQDSRALSKHLPILRYGLSSILETIKQNIWTMRTIELWMKKMYGKNFFDIESWQDEGNADWKGAFIALIWGSNFFFFFWKRPWITQKSCWTQPYYLRNRRVHWSKALLNNHKLFLYLETADLATVSHATVTLKHSYCDVLYMPLTKNWKL